MKINMKNEKLFPLFQPLTTLKGIGPKTVKKLTDLTGGQGRIIDLLFHLPVNIIDRTYSPKLDDAEENSIATLTIKIDKHIPPQRYRKTSYQVVCSDMQKSRRKLYINFFNPRPEYINEILPIGETKVVSGKINFYQKKLSMMHPDYIVNENEKDKILIKEPIYPLTQGITNKLVKNTIQEALKLLPDFDEWLDKNLIKIENLNSFKNALIKVHSPENTNDLSAKNKDKIRLAYDEILSSQLSLGIMRERHKKEAGIKMVGTNKLRDAVRKKLPFKLTNAQENVIKEIDHDMAEPYKMLRLVQGDVGSGKTLVALMTMLTAIENNTQSCLMAPTDLLTRQHYHKLKEITKDLGIHIAILTGRDKGKERTLKLKMLEEGHIDILVGTHALFQKKIKFNNLTLAVIDEQHRFGVDQRVFLSEKGNQTNILSMTATPIPRTLTMTMYGDMEVSQINELPPGRQPIDTILLSQGKMEELIHKLKNKIAEGEKIYWVCPLVEESEKLDLAAAETRHRFLIDYLGKSVGLIHGKMDNNDKDHIMADFINPNGQTKLLVSTTVIEVGVDVPDATIMIIEHAERFGLAQLHQLRGRIGRGHKKSVCILMYGDKLSDNGKQRLNVMRSTQNGFIIAEEDLMLRGAGEILGTKQSGLPKFKLADYAEHKKMFIDAMKETKYILDTDPHLTSARGENLKTLLYLFEQDKKMQKLSGG